jgi:hypothetical protein
MDANEFSFFRWPTTAIGPGNPGSAFGEVLWVKELIKDE